MAKGLYSMKLEPELKQRIEDRAKALGMSTAAFLRSAAIEKLEGAQ